jgi:hypothetical protein
MMAQINSKSWSSQGASCGESSRPWHFVIHPGSFTGHTYYRGSPKIVFALVPGPEQIYKIAKFFGARKFFWDSNPRFPFGRFPSAPISKKGNYSQVAYPVAKAWRPVFYYLRSNSPFLAARSCQPPPEQQTERKREEFGQHGVCRTVRQTSGVLGGSVEARKNVEVSARLALPREGSWCRRPVNINEFATISSLPKESAILS